eukprot:215525-Pyramimonas_sp.AAC.1
MNLERRKKLEDELKDSSGFVDYLLPRPIRKALTGFSAVACFFGSFIGISKVLVRISSNSSADEGICVKLIRKKQSHGVEFDISVCSPYPAPLCDDPELDSVYTSSACALRGLVVFSVLFFLDVKGEEQRVQQRQEVRDRQIELGDRVVERNETGELVASKLKPVDDEWILKRLDRWGKKEDMPFLGPKKASMMQDMIKESGAKSFLEVGTLAGYSAISAAQVNIILDMLRKQTDPLLGPSETPPNRLSDPLLNPHTAGGGSRGTGGEH